MIRVCPSCHAKNRVPASRLDATPKCGKCKAAIGPLRAPVPVATAADFDDLVKGSPLPVLVDFWAAWCGPCRMVAPELEKLAERLAGEVVVAKVDTEALPQVAGRFGIRSIPTMVLFRGGAESARVSGAMPHDEIARRVGLGGPRVHV
ncbi:MAG: thioredoxin TrxC [Sandaracinaceae bacterium]